MILPELFYARDTATVARELLGKCIVRSLNGSVISCRIVEAEAYYGQNDAASHACKGPTPRSAIMFGPPGRAYVYFNYGVHYLFNIVTEQKGVAGAVLIRAVEPVSGVELMKSNRQVDNIYNLTNGPGKLTQALKISLQENGLTLFNRHLSVCGNGVNINEAEIGATSRIGISAGKEHLYRFYIKDNMYVSKR